MTTYFRKGKSLYSSTTNSFGTGESETITPASVTGLPTSEITLTFDKDVSGKLERIRGTITGGNFVVASGGRGVDGTTEQAHTSPTVEYVFNAADLNDMVDGFDVEHSIDGTHDATKVVAIAGAQTITGAKTFGAGLLKATSPQITTGINDSAGNEVIKTPATASAINEITVTNAASGNSPIISATGGGTDIGITLTPKGTGKVTVSANDFGLATGANVQVNGADPKRGIYVPSSGMYGATTSGAATGQYESSTNKVNVKVLDFDKDADEYACFNLPAPDYWDLGTITAAFHWTAASGATSNTVVFGLQGLCRSNDDALDTAYGTGVAAAADNLITALDEHITASTTAITLGGTPAKGCMIYFRIYRDISEDDLPADARLLGVRIKFGISQFDDQ
jgi:hypothetical protein